MKRQFGKLKLSLYECCTKEWKDKIRRCYGTPKSKVSDINSEDLIWMIEGLMKSFGKSTSDYGMHIIPLTLCETGMRVVVDTEITEKDSVDDISFKAQKMLYLLGMPTGVIIINNHVCFEWTRNIVVWF